MRMILAIFLPFLHFFMAGRAGAGMICLLLQLSIVGWHVASFWAVYDLARRDGRNEAGYASATVN